MTKTKLFIAFLFLAPALGIAIADTTTDTTHTREDVSTSSAPKTIGREYWQAKDASGNLQTIAMVRVDQGDKTDDSNDGLISIQIARDGAPIAVYQATSDATTGLVTVDIGAIDRADGQVNIHASNVDFNGGVTIGSQDGAAPTAIYGPIALGIAGSPSMPTHDVTFGKSIHVPAKAYLYGGVDVDGPAYFYEAPLFAAGAASLGSIESYVEMGAPRFTVSGGPTWTSGAADPEGVVSAPVGSFYSRTAGGGEPAFYVKESGTGSSGWTAK